MTFQKTVLAGTLSLLVAGIPLEAAAEEPVPVPVPVLSPVEVTADSDHSTTENSESYTTRSMSTATRMNLSPRETPQSVSVITREMLDDLNLVTVNDALEATPGVTVERVETDRTYFTSRGFDISNFQVDGVGTPLHWGIADGDLDMALYDRVEIVRGASGLMAGVGNPSATVNLVRKRPTPETQASVKTSVGSWDDYRVDTDLSGSVSDSVRGRVVASQQQKESWLQDYAKDLSVIYGVAEMDLGENTLLTAGASRQQSNADSPLWGALTLVYSDGSLAHFDESSSTSADWAYWDVEETRAFVEVAHQLNDRWQAKAVWNRTEIVEDAQMLYMYSTTGTLNLDNTGLTGWASKYDMESATDLLDASVSGTFDWRGLSHDLVAGVNWASGDATETSLYDYSTGLGFPDIGDFTRWTGNTPLPVFTADPANYPDGSDIKDSQRGVYAATRIRIIQPLSLIAGGRLVTFYSKGEGYGETENTRISDELIPYAGLVYDLDQVWSLYTSYAETFQPQTDVDINQKRLDPATGNNLEAGVKAALNDGALNATFAVFEAEHHNVSESAGFDSVIGSYYAGNDYDSRGFEAELVGALTERVNTSIGYTNLTIDNPDGSEGRNFIPKQTLKLLASYNPAAVEALKVGAGANWQSDTYYEVATPLAVNPVTRLVKESVTVVNLFANYRFTPQVSGALNLNNVTKERYLTSLMWGQAYYAAPMNVVASVTWNY